MLFRKIPSTDWHDIPKDATIIDVREPYEFRRIKGYKTVNVPLTQITNYETKGSVYVMCASGSRSKRAVKMLRKKNIEAINIRGGMLTYGK